MTVTRFKMQSLPETFYSVATIEFEGHKGCGGSFDVEVEFIQTPTFGDPTTGQSDGGERTIIAVRPFERRIVPETGRLGTHRHYLACPSWLEATLRDAINANDLEARE